PHQRLYLGTRKLPPVPRQVVVLLGDAYRLVHAFLLAFDGQPRVVQMRAHVQKNLQRADILVQSAKEGFNFSGDVYSALHPLGGFCCRTDRVADGIPPENFWLQSSLNTEKLQTP